jgi:hypothetical protein
MNRSTRSALARLAALLIAGTVALVAASGCAAASGGGTPAGLHPQWQAHMSAGLDAWQTGNVEAAARHYRDAVKVARERGLPAEEMAFSTYRLGEAIRVRPETARGEAALALFEESRLHFERAYGPDHPVLIPVWVRIASLQAANGESAAAVDARARADGIAVRSFPESHFLRERYGAARPGLMLHPLEVLQLLRDQQPGSARVVQGP